MPKLSSAEGSQSLPLVELGQAVKPPPNPSHHSLPGYDLKKPHPSIHPIPHKNMASPLIPPPNEQFSPSYPTPKTQKSAHDNVPLNPRYAPSISNPSSRASPSPSSSCALIPFNRINQLMILPLPSKSRVTSFTLWINSASKGCNASLESMLSLRASRTVMKFSVAVRIWDPDAVVGPVVVVVGGAPGAEVLRGVDEEGGGWW